MKAALPMANPFPDALELWHWPVHTLGHDPLQDALPGTGEIISTSSSSSFGTGASTDLNRRGAQGAIVTSSTASTSRDHQNKQTILALVCT